MQRRIVTYGLGGALFILVATANGAGYHFGDSDQAFYIPVVIWAVYIALTTWDMLIELGRAPDRAQVPASESTARQG